MWPEPVSRERAGRREDRARREPSPVMPCVVRTWVTPRTLLGPRGVVMSQAQPLAARGAAWLCECRLQPLGGAPRACTPAPRWLTAAAPGFRSHSFFSIDM